MTKVFLNYRKADTDFGAHVLDQKLSERFGSDQVFLASKSIPLGAAWESAMMAAVAESDAVLVIIGRHWLTASDENGQLIRQENDFVRREILLARELGKLIIPVRLQAPRFTATDLPAELSWLPECQDIEVRFRSAQADVDHLANRLRVLLPGLDRTTRITTPPDSRIYVNSGKITNLWQMENTKIAGDFNIAPQVHYHHEADDE